MEGLGIEPSILRMLRVQSATELYPALQDPHLSAVDSLGLVVAPLFSVALPFSLVS